MELGAQAEVLRGFIGRCIDELQVAASSDDAPADAAAIKHMLGLTVELQAHLERLKTVMGQMPRPASPAAPLSAVRRLRRRDLLSYEPPAPKASDADLEMFTPRSAQEFAEATAPARKPPAAPRRTYGTNVGVPTVTTTPLGPAAPTTAAQREARATPLARPDVPWISTGSSSSSSARKLPTLADPRTQGTKRGPPPSFDVDVVTAHQPVLATDELENAQRWSLPTPQTPPAARQPLRVVDWDAARPPPTFAPPLQVHEVRTPRRASLAVTQPTTPTTPATQTPARPAPTPTPAPDEASPVFAWEESQAY